jgi:hypothetical protein
LINPKENCCQVNAPTKYNTIPLAANILVPLWYNNDESITINLHLQPNGEKICTLTCQLKKGDAYIVHCKNHTNQKTKCTVNTVNCALHCKMHNLVVDFTEQDFQALVISFKVPDKKDLQPPQEEHYEKQESRYILYKNKMFELVDNDGDGLCLFYSVSSFLRDLLSQEKSSTPDAWVPFINLNNSTGFCGSKAALFLTKILCTLSEADFNMLINYTGFSDDEKPKQLPTEYTLVVENLRNNVLVKTELTQKEAIIKWVTHFIYGMINAPNTKDGSWPGDIHAFVLSKTPIIRIVIVINFWMGLKEGWFDTDTAFLMTSCQDFQTPYQVKHPKIKKHVTCIE